MLAAPVYISQFSPQRTDPAYLERILVARHQLLADSVEKVRESVLTANKHHLLFIGPRGAGKTHLITLIHHRIAQQRDLRGKFRVAWLNEDETSTTFLKLLIRIYRDLTQRYPAEFPQADHDRIYGQDETVARDLLGQALIRHLKGRTLVLLMENLDVLFDAMHEVEQRTWRAFLQDHSAIATVGTSQSLFVGVTKRTEPFFGFFHTEHLKTLSVEAATTLLKNLAALEGKKDLVQFLESAKGKARVRAIHHLSGGNPRLYIILSEFLTKELLDDLVRPFAEMVDKQLTSYYQERLRSLSHQQHEIVQFLCRTAHPVPVKQIADGIFVSHSTVTNQLGILRKKGYLNSLPRGREVFYELAEPLMRLSIQVKEANNRQPLALIVDFLRVWYDREEIEARIAELGGGAMGLDYFLAAKEKILAEGNLLRVKILQECVDGVDVTQCNENEIDALESLAQETQAAGDWLALGRARFYRERPELALVAVTNAIAAAVSEGKDPTFDLLLRASVCASLGNQIQILEDLSIVLKNVDGYWQDLVRLFRGSAYFLCGQPDLAVEDFRAAIKGGNLDAARSLHCGAVLVMAGKYAEGFHQIEKVLSGQEPGEFLDKDWDLLGNLGMALVMAARDMNVNGEPWLPRLQPMVGKLPEQMLTEMGGYSVVFIARMRSPAIAPTALRRWSDGWNHLAQCAPALEISARMLRAAASWIEFRDDRVLFELALEERSLVREALDLPPE